MQGLSRSKISALWDEVLTEHHESHEVNDPIKETLLSGWERGLRTGREAGKLAERANLGNWPWRGSFA